MSCSRGRWKKICTNSHKKRKGGGSANAPHCARSASDLEPGLLRREAPRRRRRFHCRTREEGLVGRRSITFKARSNSSTELIERDAPTLSYNDSSFALKGRGSVYFVIVLLVVVLQLSLSNVMHICVIWTSPIYRMWGSLGSFRWVMHVFSSYSPFQIWRNQLYAGVCKTAGAAESTCSKISRQKDRDGPTFNEHNTHNGTRTFQLCHNQTLLTVDSKRKREGDR